MNGIMWEATNADWGIDDSDSDVEGALRDAGWQGVWAFETTSGCGISLYETDKPRFDGHGLSRRYGLLLFVEDRAVKTPLCGNFGEALEAIRQLEVLFLGHDSLEAAERLAGAQQ